MPPKFQGRVGLSSLGDRPTPENALDFVLFALRAREPQALEALRDAQGENEEEVVRAWTYQHWLFPTPLIVDYMTHQRERWRKYPHHAATLDLGGLSYAVVLIPPDSDEDWVKRHTEDTHLPNPYVETLGEWLKRAKQLYVDRRSLRRLARPPTPRWSRFAQHCDWFVQVQVQSIPPGKLAKRYGVDRAGVERAVNRISKLLHVPRQRWPKGRPYKQL